MTRIRRAVLAETENELSSWSENSCWTEGWSRREKGYWMDFTTKVENGTAILGGRMMCCHKPPGRVGKLWRVEQS